MLAGKREIWPATQQELSPVLKDKIFQGALDRWPIAGKMVEAFVCC